MKRHYSDNVRVVRIASCSIPYVCIKRKINNSDQQSPIVARCLWWTVDGSNALLYEPMVNFSAKLYGLAADEIAAFWLVAWLSGNALVSIKVTLYAGPG